MNGGESIRALEFMAANWHKVQSPQPPALLSHSHSHGKQYLVATAPCGMATASWHNYELINSKTSIFSHPLANQISRSLEDSVMIDDEYLILSMMYQPSQAERGCGERRAIHEEQWSSRNPKMTTASVQGKHTQWKQAEQMRYRSKGGFKEESCDIELRLQGEGQHVLTFSTKMWHFQLYLLELDMLEFPCLVNSKPSM